MVNVFKDNFFFESQAETVNTYTMSDGKQIKFENHREYNPFYLEFYLPGP